jgi:hypothetical protein
LSNDEWFQFGRDITKISLMAVDVALLAVGAGEVKTALSAAKTVRLEGVLGRIFGREAKGLVGDVAKAATKAGKSIVIGEGMDDIKVVAKQLQGQGIDAKWYQAWGKYFEKGNFNLDASKARNFNWIKSKADQGYTIYDIGINPLKPTRSPFYEVETNYLDLINYPRIPLKRP